MMLAPSAFAGHVPVLLAPILERTAPVAGTWLDGTFGAGGYARALIAAGAARVIGLDRDPAALARAAPLEAAFGDRLDLREARFSALDRIATEAGAPRLDGVVLDIGVSSMQLDTAGRGFSFQSDGPLDMRMGAGGPTAADLVNHTHEDKLADILHQYGEERAARRIARAIATDRAAAPFTTTRQLAGLIERLMPRSKPGQPHPATRAFQALRIAVNDELGELARGLVAAEAALAPGGWLAVVSFHSLEDRIVKRFLQDRSGTAPRTSRHAPEAASEPPRFALAPRRAILPEPSEIAANPRARSARLRLARRTDAAAGHPDPRALGLPPLTLADLPA